MAQIKTALLKFDNPKYNHCRQFSEYTDNAIMHERYYDKQIAVRGYQGTQRCTGVRFASVTAQVIDQVVFKELYDDYMKHFADQGILPWCSSVRALSSWTRRTFDTWDCDWQFTDEFVNDKHNLPQQIGLFKGKKFVLIDIESTWIFQHAKNKVRGYNDNQYGRAEPIQKVGESFYNKDAQLIFYIDEEQKNNLQEQYDNYHDRKKGWNAYDKVKKNISLTNWVECNDQVAWFFMESVPPKIFGLTRFLSGEGVDHTDEGYIIYQEFKKISDDKWLTKYSTVQMFKDKK